jgi:hypothetical protein
LTISYSLPILLEQIRMSETFIAKGYLARIQDQESSFHETEGLPASQLWKKILLSNPNVTHFITARYRKSGVKENVFRNSVTDIDTVLTNSNTTNLPYSTSISSIVGTTDVNPGLSMILTQRPNSLRLHNPRSFINFDLSCNISPENTLMLTDVLKDIPNDWYLLQTKLSYHIVINKLVELTDLAGSWGVILKSLSAKSPNKFVQDNGSMVADSLMNNSASPTGLQIHTERLINQIFENIDTKMGGYKKFSDLSILDWGHLNYSLRDLIYFFKGYAAGTGYLRIDNKGSSPPPLVIVQKENGTISKSDPASYFSKQPHLL